MAKNTSKELTSTEKLCSEIYSNPLFTAILDSIDSGICVVDMHKKIVFANKKQLEIHNHKLEDILGKNVNDIFQGTGHIEVLQTKKRVEKDEIEFAEIGTSVRPKYIPLTDEADNLIASLGVVKSTQDIREVSIEIKSLSNIYERFSVIFDNLQEGIIAVDKTGQVVYVNDAYSRIKGTEKSEILNKKKTHDELGKIIFAMLNNATSIHENIFMHGDRTMEVVSMPIIVDNQIAGGFCILRDTSTEFVLASKLERKTQIAEYFKRQLYIQKQNPWFKEIIGESPALLEQINVAAKAANTDCKVMIRGNNGVGKDLMAKAIHKASTRATGPFISVNCGALPDTLLESELFGYEEGAFTGASKKGKAGKFELANGGTLFLDEIGNMSPLMQTKLLRVLQNMENERVGATKVTKLDVRLITATNADIEQMVIDGTFREDLYYRMNVVMINIPDLRERASDIKLLTEHFLQQIGEKVNKKYTISNEALRLLEEYPWPGNVRELRNVIEHATVFAEKGIIEPYNLPTNLWLNDEPSAKVVILGSLGKLETVVEECEKAAIERALAENKNNRTRAMEQLGLSKRAFYYKLSKYSLHNK